MIVKKCKCGCEYISKHTLSECINCKKFQSSPKHTHKPKLQIKKEQMEKILGKKLK